MLNDWLKLGRQRKQISTADDPTRLNSLKQWIIVRTDVCGGCDVIETNRRHKTGRSPGRCDGAGMHREVLLVIDSHIDAPTPPPSRNQSLQDRSPSTATTAAAGI